MDLPGTEETVSASTSCRYFGLPHCAICAKQLFSLKLELEETNDEQALDLSEDSGQLRGL